MSGNTPKRPFEREFGMLVDRYHYGNTPCEWHLVESDVLLRAATAPGEVVRGSDTRFLAPIGRRRAEEPTHEQLLAGLREFDAAAPFGLLNYLDRPGTREALVEATKRVSARNLATYAQALAVLGGEQAVVVLRSRRDELHALLGPAADTSSTTDIRPMMGLMSCVVAGLAIDSADTEAARMLLEMMGSRLAWWRNLAFARAEELASRLCSRGAGIELVRRELEARARSSDLDVFVRIGPYLMLTDQTQTMGRCDAEIPIADAPRRSQLYNVLRHTTPPSIGIARLLVWLQQEDDIRLALGLMSHLHPLVAESLAHRVLRSALASDSPSLRMRAIGARNTVSIALHRSLLEAALQDEPDPLLADILQTLVSSLP